MQYASQRPDAGALIDEDRISLALAYFPGGHGNNFKLAFTHIDRSPGDTSDQFQLQWQVFQF